MKFKDLKKSLSEGLKPIYLIEGEDSFLRENALRLIKSKALSEPDLNLTNLYGQDVKGDSELLLTATESYPFMSEKRYVVVRDYYPTATELKSKILQRIFNEPCDFTCTVIINAERSEPLKKLQTITVVDCEKADVSLIQSWVRNKALENNVVILESALNKLIEFCSLDMQRISGETEKLISFVGSNSEITEEAVELLVGKDTDFQIYELTEAVARRSYDKSFEILYDLINKNQDKQRLFISIYYHFRRLFHASVSKSTSLELSAYLGVKEYVAKKAKEQAVRFGARRLKQIVDKLGYYDGAFKSGEISVDTALWNSILNSMLTE